MSDEKPSDDPRAKVAFAVAKHAVDALLGDEERAKRRTEDVALARSKRNKRIAQIVIGGLIVIGLVGLMINYWYWALLLGLLGAAGWYVRRRWRARRTERKKLDSAAPREATASKKVRVAPPAARLEEPESSIEDDLAELKARMKR